MRKLTLLLSVFLLWGVKPLAAQNEVSFSLSTARSGFRPGESFTAVIKAQVQSGWHLYSTTQPAGGPVATSITLGENPVFKAAGELRYPPAESSFDPNFNIETEYYEGTVEFLLPVRVNAGARPGAHELPVKIRYMLCSDTMCLPPQTAVVRKSLAVTAGAAEQKQSSAEPPAGLPGQTSGLPESNSEGQRTEGNEHAGQGTGAPDGRRTGESVTQTTDSETPGGAAGQAVPLGFWAYIWFAAAMAGLALLTPCVFPMIPITVSYFTKRQSASRQQAVKEAFLYSVGIVLTFTVLGFALTFLFGAGGINRLAASPFVNVVIALVFILFALSLFGAFEIRLPSRWLTAVDRQSSRTGGVAGILLMALTFSLTSFTCTVPFVGTVMVAALQGDWLWSLLGVAVFAAVFSAPFFLLAVFPSLLKALPKSGNWMNSLKVTMGFLELAAAIKFLSNVDLVYQWELITRPVFIAVWLAIALVTAVYLLGWFRLPHETAQESIGAFRVLSATFFFALAFYLFRGLLGFPLGEVDAFLPPRDYGGVHAAFSSAGRDTENAAREHWLTDYREALEIARRENRPIFIDFTGYTCTNCRWMEANMFPLREVRELFSRYVLVRLYTDGPEEEHAANLEFERARFGTIALPYYAIMSTDDRTIATFPGLTRDPSVFIGFLRSGLETQVSSDAQRLRPGGLQ